MNRNTAVSPEHLSSFSSHSMKDAALIMLPIGLNIAALAWAMAALHCHPVLFAAAMLAYGLGLHCAVGADHIAAIAGTRRRRKGKRRANVGFFFSLRQSIIIALTCAVVAEAVSICTAPFEAWHISASIAPLFLVAVAVMNIVMLARVYRGFCRTASGEDVTVPLAARFPTGLGSVAGLLSVIAAETAGGVPIWSIMILPALFTASMLLVDTANSILSSGTYGWMFSQPVRKPLPHEVLGDAAMA